MMSDEGVRGDDGPGAGAVRGDVVTEAATTVRRGPDGRFQIRRIGGQTWERGDVQDAFLLALSLTANVVKSADEVGLPARGAYMLRQRDPHFRERWLQALVDGTEFVRLKLIEWAAAEATVPVDEDGEADRKLMRDFDPKVAIRLLGMHGPTARGEVLGMNRPTPLDADALRAVIRARMEEVLGATGAAGDAGGGAAGDAAGGGASDDAG